MKNTDNPGTPRLQEARRQSKLRLLLWVCALSVCLPALISISGWAQVLFGSMVGTVTDSSGAAVPGVTVKITNTQTNDTRTVQTSGAGVYTVSTIPAGTYRVDISKQGFNGFVTPSVEVVANQVVRVDAQLQVGTVSQTVQVLGAAAAQLQTDTADVHTEISSQALINVPQPTRTYEGIFNLVPGMTPPGGQLAGGTNNPSKSMQFAANGTGFIGANVRIGGVSAQAPWGQSGANTSFVPSVEAIQSVNVVTNSPDAEQGLAGGPSVTVELRSGSNGVHGAFYWYNINNATEARNFFAPGQKPSHLVDNDTGGWISGPIIPNKLFYFAGYEGDFIEQGFPGLIGTPPPALLAGNFAGSPNPIYDPASGNADGTGRKPFPGNQIPANRIAPAIEKLIPLIPAPNEPGVVNNYLTTQSTTYNLHKIDTKIDYQTTSKLRVSGRYGYQPYFNTNSPLFGPILGGASDGWAAFEANQAGNYLQYGATLAVSASATYVASPTLVIDGTFGVTQAHQLLFPPLADQKYGSDVLGIPGTNIGTLPFAGGMPIFTIDNYGGPTFGYAYPPLEYKDPIFEYTANVTKIKGSHNIRAGMDLRRIHINHNERNPTTFTFSGEVTSTPGGQDPTAYNAVADFLLGLPTSMASAYSNGLATVREYDFSIYVRDQWQASHKLTLNYGVRWEYYPVPTAADRGLEYNNLASDLNNPTIEICGVGGNPRNCGITVSKKLFAPTLGIAYRATDNLVIRTGFSLSPIQSSMAEVEVQNYPVVVRGSYSGTNSFTPAGDVRTGLPVIPVPDISSGTLPVPRGGAGINTMPKNFVRGYVESYNMTLQRQFPGGFVGQVGYVGTHVVHQIGSVNFNYGQLGGGAKSQPLNRYGVTGSTTQSGPATYDLYSALQASLRKRLTHGLSVQLAYTWSKEIVGGYTSTLPTGGTGIAIPQFLSLNTQLAPNDRTNAFVVSPTYELPFGKNKPFLTHGIAAAVLGGWTLNGVFYHYSGLPFGVSASGGSCNCPGSTQRANQVKAHVAKVGSGVNGQAYFDPTAFAPVTTATFGNSSYSALRGPGATNLDASVFRTIPIWERLSMQFRAEAFNVTNTPHFGNPGANVSSASFNSAGNITALNGYSQITGLNPLGRLLDPRYFRFGVRFAF